MRGRREDMMNRFAMLLAAAALVGCSAGKSTIKIANTPEGHACATACMQTYYACIGSAQGAGQLVAIPHCKAELETCGLGCPGAHRIAAE